MKKSFLLFIITIGIALSNFAQEKSARESRGDKHFFRYSFDKAIDCYTRTKVLTVEGQRKLAESYHNLGMNDQSEGTYSKLIAESGGAIPEDYQNYAMTLRMNGKNAEANRWMEKYAEMRPKDLRVIDYKANISRLPDFQKDQGKYIVKYLTINSKALEFGTSYYGDKIVFASTKEAPKMIARRYNWTRQPFWDMYVADVDDGQLKNPEVFAKKLNGKWHDGPASFSNNGNFMAFTRNNHHDKSSDKVIELQIFFSNMVDGAWSEPEPFYLNKESYSVGHPCLSANGQTMYFASDMPGGFGGTDLYRVTREGNGTWGKAENLGSGINTESDEMFPFYEETNNVLFFSSNGRLGLGGLDIFRADANGSAFAPATNLGAPLNSEYDDYALIVDNKLSKGYFSSSRFEGKRGDDMYSVNFLDILDVSFIVNSPENIPVERRVRETFPLRNYIFFDPGSTKISDRYVLLQKDQVKDFKEDQLEVFTPKRLSGRADRQMIVYYNILNILGDRMQKNPNAAITLVGSSDKGPADGRIMAESVKAYLVDIFEIASSRINIEGRDKPKLPSEQPGGTRELTLLQEGDQRVSIESGSPSMLMEFQSGPEAALKPIEIVSVEKAPLDSYVTFKVDGAEEKLSSWSLEIKDKNGIIQNFGPYTDELVAIPGRLILGDLEKGDYKARMIGKAKNGKTITKEADLKMALWTPAANEEMMRFSIIYEFDASKAIQMYEKYLTEIVVPKIPRGGSVIIHGHTDIIGDATYNKTLSIARANDVLKIMKNALANAGRKDVKLTALGFGEDVKLSPFNNSSPEERFYNRTVIIDIIPPK